VPFDELKIARFVITNPFNPATVKTLQNIQQSMCTDNIYTKVASCNNLLEMLTEEDMMIVTMFWSFGYGDDCIAATIA
jgi:hypothetical protein